VAFRERFARVVVAVGLQGWRRPTSQDGRG
jgi:hypothetical protein